MRDFFAMIYECFLYDNNYILLFNELYQGDGYILLGLALLLIPLLLFVLFYWDSRMPWGNPYRKKFSWFIWLFITAIVIIGVSYGIIYSALFSSSTPALIQAMNDPATFYWPFAEKLTLYIAILNGAYSLLVSFLWSLLLKQKSVLHIHIPF